MEEQTSQHEHIIDRRGTNSVKWDFVFHDYEMTALERGDDPLAQDQLLPLWVADMDFASPPAMVEALVKRAQHGVFGYSVPDEAFFRAIINWMARRHNWQVEKEWILTMPGVVPSLNMILQAYTRPGDYVVIQTPVYHPFYSSVENNGCQIRCNPLILRDGQYEIDWDNLTMHFSDPKTTMMFLCSPHNPAGRVWTAEELHKLSSLCVEHNVLLISDEIHHDLIFSWAEFTTIGVAHPAGLDNTIICTAPSKTFNIPGLKTSNVFVSNPRLRQQLQRVTERNGLFGANAFGVLALQTAYETGEAWLAETMAYIEANYHFMEQYLRDNLPQLKIMQPGGTYLVWVDCSALGLDADGLHDLFMNQANVYLSGGQGFGDDGATFMRFNIACSRAILAEALERINKAIKAL